MSKGLDALKEIKEFAKNEWEDERFDFATIEKELKRLDELEKAFVALSKDDEKAKKLLSLEIEKNRALNEILALYNKWLGNEMSDFEFFTLLNEITNKYDLLK